MSNMPELFIENCVNALTRLYNEGLEMKTLNDANEYAKRGNAIAFILNKIENDFSTDDMVYVYIKTSKKLGKSLNPISIEILKKLENSGCCLKKVQSVVTPTPLTSTSV